MKPTGKAYNKNTILPNGEGQYTGWLGERAFALDLLDREIPFEWVGPSKGGIDFYVKYGNKWVTIDVKSKARNVTYNPIYDAHVTQDQIKHDVRIYVFAHVDNHSENVIFAGWEWKRVFWETAQLVKKGDIDSRGKPERADAGKCQYLALREYDELMEIIEREKI